MAKAEVSGTVTAFRQSKFKEDSYQTIVALHGRKGALRVRWDRGFPPQGLGTQVKILP